MFPQVALSIKESEGGKEGMELELEDNFQDITSPQNKEDQITADPKNLQKKLDKLKDVMSEECFKYAQRLVNKPPPDPDLLQFLIHLHKDLHHKSNKGPNNSERSESGYKAKTSSCSLFFWTKATVKVFLVVTGRTCGADQDILEQVKNMGRSTQVEITTNLQECDIIIVFCPITSRVGSDVESAMRENSVSCGGKPVILVLMHHTRDPDYSTDVRRWSETFQNVLLDVDVLFHQTQPGLLRCSRNDRAVKLIQEQLKKRGKDQDVQPEQEEEKKPGRSVYQDIENTSTFVPAPEEFGGWEEVMSEDNSQKASSSQQDGEEITADTKNLQMEVNTLKMDNKNLQMEVNTLKMDNKNLQKEVNTLKMDMENMQEILKVLQTDLKKPHQKSDKAPNNSERSGEPPYKAKPSSSSSSSWTTATVKVFLVVTGWTFGADYDILEQVKRSPEVETTRNPQECDLIIVFCSILSRVGSDVEAAMREDSVSSGGKPVILVLMHHTRDPDYSTDVRRWSETFQNVVLDVHVLFHESQPGLLSCSRNDRAVKLIQEKLKKPVWYKPF